MCLSYKRLKGKEMGPRQGNIMRQVAHPERDSGGEEEEKRGSNECRVSRFGRLVRKSFTSPPRPFYASPRRRPPPSSAGDPRIALFPWQGPIARLLRRA